MVETGLSSLAVIVNVAVTTPEVVVAIAVEVSVTLPVAILEHAYVISDALQVPTTEGVATPSLGPGSLAAKRGVVAAADDMLETCPTLRGNARHPLTWEFHE